MNKNAHTLRNPWLEVTIRPDLGGRIDSFVDRTQQHDWVWHPPTYEPNRNRSLPRGASFDDNWTGGWDDIFPNDAPDPFQGRALHDHGEVWSQALTVREASPDGIAMELACSSLPLVFEKRVVLEKEAPVCHITHRIHNRSDQPQAFLFKQHPALAIEPGDTIMMPDCDLEPVALGFSMIAGSADATRFPYVRDAQGQRVRIDQMQAREAGTREFLYAKNLEGHYAGIRNHRTRTELLFCFDTQKFPYVWLFTSFSGFRDHYVLMLEPCTNIPFDLETAFRQKTCAVIEPQATLEYQTEVRIQKVVNPD